MADTKLQSPSWFFQENPPTNLQKIIFQKKFSFSEHFFASANPCLKNKNREGSKVNMDKMEKERKKKLAFCLRGFYDKDSLSAYGLCLKGMARKWTKKSTGDYGFADQSHSAFKTTRLSFKESRQTPPKEEVRPQKLPRKETPELLRKEARDGSICIIL